MQKNKTYIGIKNADYSFLKWTVIDMKNAVEQEKIELLRVQKHWAGFDKITASDAELAVQTIGEFYYGSRTVIECVDNISMTHSDSKMREAAFTLKSQYSTFLSKLAMDKINYDIVRKIILDKNAHPQLHVLLEKINKKQKQLGLHLPKNVLDKIQKSIEKINNLTVTYEQRINEYDAYILVSKFDFGDAPETYISSLEKEKEQYKVSVKANESSTFFAYSPNDALIKKLQKLMLLKGGAKNVHILETVIAERQKIAGLMGYDNFSDMNIATRAAQTIGNVQKLLSSVSKSIQPLLKIDRKHLDMIASVKPIPDWMLPRLSRRYVSEVLKTPNAEELKPYFTSERVMSVMLDFFSKLFGISFTKTKQKYWDTSVFGYDVIDVKSKKQLGSIVFDLLPRKGKYAHACSGTLFCDQIVDWENKIVHYTPRTNVIICNFAKPGLSVPSLLKLYDIETLWHEMGHALNDVMSSHMPNALAGYNLVWDLVETPSQFCERFANLPEMIYEMSEHYKTGEKLDKKIINALCATEYAMMATGYNRQIMQSEFDITVHSGLEKNTSSFFMKLVQLKEPSISYNPLTKLFPGRFAHIIHGYEAGYYSYLWAEVAAQELFAVAKTLKGKKLADFGRKLRNEFFGIGGSRPEMESLTVVLGRKPNGSVIGRELVDGYKRLDMYLKALGNK